MEDFALDIVIGKGPAARSIRLDIPKFTLVAATTRSGMLTGPLRDRFGISYRLDYYTVEELAQIVTRSATPVVLWDLRPLPARWARTQARSRMSMSPICCSAD